jgi:hypothetical protein
MSAMLEYCFRCKVAFAIAVIICTAVVAFFAHTADGLWSILLFLFCPMSPEGKEDEG